MASEPMPWWQTVSVEIGYSPLPMPTRCVIECRSCGEQFECWDMVGIPRECPECRSEGTKG